MTEIPKNILTQIQAEASEAWPDDTDMQKDMIENETEAYLSLRGVDFGKALSHKDFILAEAEQYSAMWEERLSFVRDEVQSYADLQDMFFEDIPAEILTQAKEDAASKHSWFSAQLDALQRDLQVYRNVQETRAKVEPIRKLLMRMEQIIGKSCYNGNIQNYASWGVLESQGRSFRYPVTFLMSDDSKQKRWDRQDDLPSETLITGHYKVGANEMDIYRALVEIVDMLEADYDFKPPRR